MPVPIGVVSHVIDTSYVGSVFEADRRLMAILELSPHALMAQRVAKSLHFGHPGFLESDEHTVDMRIRAAVEAGLSAIVDQSILAG